MRVLLPLLLLASATTLGTVAAAPVPKDTEKPLYFPTQVGAKMVFKDESGDYRSEGKIADAETKDGVTTIAVEWSLFNKQDGESTVKEKLAVSAKGVFRTAMSGVDLAPPLCLLKLPLKTGDKWDTSFTYAGMKSVGTAVAGEPEEVPTPAGKFTAVPVHYEYTLNKVTRHMTYWYAPRVGLVQQNFTGYKQEPKLLVLKVFLPSKP